MACGALKPINGRMEPLVCSLDAGHALPHAIARGGLPPYARWPVAWTAADQAALDAHHTWRKPHVRRPYQTLAMWKAGR